MKSRILKSALAVTLMTALTSTGDETAACRALLSVSYEPGYEEAYIRSAESAYRECRGKTLPIDVRVEAYARYADVKVVRGEAQNGVAIYRDALMILEKENAKRGDLTIDILDRLARVENAAQLSSEAVQHARKALDLRITQYGAESPEAALGMSRLGMAFVDQKDFESAEPLIRKAIRVAQKSCGPQCDALSEAYSAMSVWYADQGSGKEAASYVQLSTDAIPSPRTAHKKH